MKKMVVVGLNKEFYAGEVCNGFNCDFTFEKKELVRWHVLCHDEEGKMYKISLENYSFPCSSGWCTASSGTIKIEEVTGAGFGPFTHRALKPFALMALEEDENGEEREVGPWVPHFPLGEEYLPEELEEIRTNVFYVRGSMDDYYPIGCANILEGNLKFFKELKRAPKKRPVWVFRGPSGTGKSTVAAKTGMKVFETDSVDELPDEIKADIVVVGHRNEFDIDDITARLGEVEVHTVTFD